MKEQCTNHDPPFPTQAFYHIYSLLPKTDLRHEYKLVTLAPRALAEHSISGSRSRCEGCTHDFQFLAAVDLSRVSRQYIKGNQSVCQHSMNTNAGLLV